MRGRVNTWQHLLAQRHGALFIGREREQELFRLNFMYQIPAHLIFALQGPAGVGKSTLMAQYRTIAEEHEAISVRVDEAQATAIQTHTILQTMVEMARQFSKAGTPFTAFEERYQEYLTYTQIVTDDFNAPGRTHDMLDGVIKAQTLQEELWNKYLFERFGNPAKIALVKTPVAALTEIFVRDMNAWATVRGMLLCFDDWDHIGPHLEGWLQGLLTQHEMRTNIWIILAGQHLIDSSWEAFRPIITRFDLQPFTEEEIRTYVSAHKITDPARVTDIVTFSRGLPVLASLLVRATGGTAGDLALTSVDRYLKWLDDPFRRDAVLQCAAARFLDTDVVAALVGDDRAEAILTWLTDTGVVIQEAGRRRYHPILRTRLRAFAEQQSPAILHAAHAALYTYYQANTGGVRRYDNAGWRAGKREALYHGLVIKEPQAVQEGIEIFLEALRNYYPLSGEIIRTWQQAAEVQLNANAVTQWNELLQTAWQALEQQAWDEVLAWCEAIDQHEDLSDDMRGEVASVRSAVQAWLPRQSFAPHDEPPTAPTAPAPPEEPENTITPDQRIAIAQPEPAAPPHPAADTEPETPVEVHEPAPLPPAPEAAAVSHAIPAEGTTTPSEKQPEMEPKAEPEAKPQTHQPMVTAAVDTQATPLQADTTFAPDASGYTHRGNAYLHAGDYPKAIQAYDIAIQFDPTYAAAYYNRGLAYARSEKYAAAIIDFTQTIALNPEHAAAYYNRGLVYMWQNAADQAIVDYNKALALNPEDAVVYNSRGNAHYKLKTYQQAIADYDQAIRYVPNYIDAYLNRGMTYATIEEYQQAIADYNQAIALNPNAAVAYNSRGLAYARLQQYARAIEDYTQAIILDPGYAAAYNNLGLCYVRMGNYAQAITEYRHAVDVMPEYATAYYNAACAAALMAEAGTACTWLEKAVQRNPRYQTMARRDTDFDAIRSDAAFQRLLREEASGEAGG